MTRLLYFLFLFSMVASAESVTERVAKCVEAETAFKRLGCFDRVVEDFGLDGQIEVVVKPGAWREFESVSKFDESVAYVLALDAEQDVAIGVYSKVNPTLYLHCKRGDFNVIINWFFYLGVGGVDGRFRLDKKRAYYERWETSPDRKSMIFPGHPVGFVKRLINHDRLLVQVTPFSESPVMAEFNIAGLLPQLAKIRKYCSF